MIQLPYRLALLAFLAAALTPPALHGQAQKNVPPAVASPDGKVFVTAQDNQISVFDVQTQKELARMLGHTGTIRSLGISPDGKLLASGGDDKTIALWDLATGKQLLKLQAPNGIIALRFTQDGKNLITQDSSMATTVWNPATGQMIQSSKPK